MSATITARPDVHAAYAHEDGSVSLIIQYDGDDFPAIVTLSREGEDVILTHDSGVRHAVNRTGYARASVAGEFEDDPESWARRFFAW